MKYPILFISGLVLCSFIAGAFVFNPDRIPKFSSDAEQSVKVVSPISPPGRSAGSITISEAKVMFQAYHQSSNIDSSKGVMKRKDGKAIESYFLDYDNVIKPLKVVIEAANETFYGVCVIPVKNPETGDNTLMFMGLIQNGDSTNQEITLYIPPSDSAGRPAFIYDYTVFCPIECPKNHDILWGN